MTENVTLVKMCFLSQSHLNQTLMIILNSICRHIYFVPDPLCSACTNLIIQNYYYTPFTKGKRGKKLTKLTQLINNWVGKFNLVCSRALAINHYDLLPW